MSTYTASIAQMLSPSRYHRAIGEGISRKAYYSPKHNVVLKVDCHCGTATSRQMGNEVALVAKLNEEEKEIFPIVSVENYKGRIVLVMKRATLYHNYVLRCDCGDGTESLTRELSKYCERNELTISNITQVVTFIEKYKVRDIHEHNIGVVDGKMVIIDMGY